MGRHTQRPDTATPTAPAKEQVTAQESLQHAMGVEQVRVGM